MAIPLYGGTKLVFSYNRSFDAVATLYPRLTPLKTSAGKELLLTSYNESDSIGREFYAVQSVPFRRTFGAGLEWPGNDAGLERSRSLRMWPTMRRVLSRIPKKMSCGF